MEDSYLAAFEGPPDRPEWLAEERAEALLAATPDQNVPPAAARQFLDQVLVAHEVWAPRLDDLARARAEAVLSSHDRVRQAIKRRGVRHRVEPNLPPDVLGLYLLLPVVE